MNKIKFKVEIFLMAITLIPYDSRDRIIIKTIHDECQCAFDAIRIYIRNQAIDFFKISGEMLMAIDRGYGNTPIHLALLKGDTASALQLIEEDKQLDKEACTINIQAQGNSPLMLALKSGNLKVAQAILDHPNVDINLPDSAGLRPIHFASLLRADNVIEKLLSMNPDPTVETPNTSYDLFKRYRPALNQILPSDFYQEKLVSLKELDLPNRISDMSSPIVPTGAALRMYDIITPHFFQSGDATKRKNKLKNDLIHLPLHSLAFQMDLISANYLPQKNRSELRPSWEDGSDAPTNVFKENFVAVYQSFETFRNAIPVKENILINLKKNEERASQLLTQKPK